MFCKILWVNWIIGVAVLIAPVTSRALESDPYLSWGTELEDGSGPIDHLIHSQFLKAFQKTSLEDLSPSSCADVARRVFGKLRRQYWVDRELHLGATLDQVQVFPPREVSSLELFKKSIYGSFKAWPFFLPLDRTFNLKGVYISADKLSHFVSQGAKYYQIYHDQIRQGASLDEAMKSAVDWGIARENGIYGKYASAVFSYSDLEANWSGFLAIMSACDAKNPLFSWDDQTQKWVLTRDFLISDYVSPFWDESFHPSRFVSFRWNVVRPRLHKYCALRNHPVVQRRMEHYHDRLQPSFSQIYIKELEKSGQLPPQSEHSLSAVCDLTPEKSNVIINKE